MAAHVFPAPEPVTGGVKLIMAADLELRAPVFLVRGVLERGVLALEYGEPGVGKTFAAMGLALSVATGEPFLDHEVPEPGPVIYVAGEGHGGVARRLKAWCQHHGYEINGIKLAVTKGPVALGDPADAMALLQAIDQIIPILGKPVLIVIDTVARNFGPGDENSTRDMSAFIASVDNLIQRYHCTVLLIHHTGHGDKTRHRGAMALKGALDAEYRLRADDGRIEMVCQKMKDSPPPQPIGMQLRVVELEGIVCDDGSPVTSVVVESADLPPPEAAAALGKNQRKALDILQGLFEERRHTLTESGRDPAGARVSVNEWREAIAAAGIDRRRWLEVRSSLVKDGLIVIDGVYVEMATDRSAARIAPDRDTTGE